LPRIHYSSSLREQMRSPNVVKRKLPGAVIFVLSLPRFAHGPGDAPAYLVVKTLDWEYTRDGEQFKVKATDPQLELLC
jgi:hypothetical protein